MEKTLHTREVTHEQIATMIACIEANAHTIDDPLWQEYQNGRLGQAISEQLACMTTIQRCIVQRLYKKDYNTTYYGGSKIALVNNFSLTYKEIDCIKEEFLRHVRMRMAQCDSMTPMVDGYAEQNDTTNFGDVAVVENMLYDTTTTTPDVCTPEDELFDWLGKQKKVEPGSIMPEPTERALERFDELGDATLEHVIEAILPGDTVADSGRAILAGYDIAGVIERTRSGDVHDVDEKWRGFKGRIYQLQHPVRLINDEEEKMLAVTDTLVEALARHVKRTNWEEQATCKNEPDITFELKRGRNGGVSRRALSLCYACPVRPECLLESTPVMGLVYGGLREAELDALQERVLKRQAALVKEYS